MKAIRITTLLGSVAGLLTLASSLAAQPVFSLSFQPEPSPELESWYFDAQTVIPRSVSGRSFLGVGVAEIDTERAKTLKLQEERGVEITKVVEDSPAAKAGLKAGDVVLEYNNQRVVGTEQFVRLVRETPVGRTVRLVVNRDGATQTITATIGSRKGRAIVVTPKVDVDRLKRDLEELRKFRMPDIPKAFMSWRTTVLGVEAESIESQLAEFFGVEEGVLVRSVMKDSPAEKAGLKAGDVIVKVDDKKVATPRDVSNIIRSAREKKTFPITVVRNRSEMTVSVTLDDERSRSEYRRRYRTIQKREVRM